MSDNYNFNDDFNIDSIDFNIDFDFSNEEPKTQISIKSDSLEDEIIDLRNLKKKDNNLDNNTLITENSNDIPLESKSTFDIGNLNRNNYNIENINAKKTSESKDNNEDKLKFDSLGNKKTFSEIKYTNNVNISDENKITGLSNKDELKGFYELEIDEYPDRTNLLHLDDTNNKSLGSNTKNTLVDKIFSIRKKK